MSEDLAVSGIADRWVLVVVGSASAVAAALSAHTALNGVLMRRADRDAPLVPKPDDGGCAVSVLIPARNEALRIGPTIASVLKSDGIASLEVLVLDDHSTDGTADVVRACAAGDDRLRVLVGEPLPEGWMGKPWACQQLGTAASGSVLVFVDADVELQPEALRATIQLMTKYRLTLVSPYPQQVAVTAGERLVQPLLQWLWLTFLPLRLAERPSPVSMAAANGQVLAVDANAWRFLGGHGVVRDEVIEDVSLARAFKRAGYRATVADGSDVVSCRMYTDWSDLQVGYSKSLWAALPNRAAAKAVAALLAFVYLIPPLAAVFGLVTGRRQVARRGGAGYAAAVVGRIISARQTGGQVRDTWMHPGSIVGLLWLGRRSWRQHDSGNLTWKGRNIHVG